VIVPAAGPRRNPRRAVRGAGVRALSAWNRHVSRVYHKMKRKGPASFAAAIQKAKRTYR
jgi:hypothetical protein